MRTILKTADRFFIRSFLILLVLIAGLFAYLIHLYQDRIAIDQRITQAHHALVRKKKEKAMLKDFLQNHSHPHKKVFLLQNCEDFSKIQLILEKTLRPFFKKRKMVLRHMVCTSQDISSKTSGKMLSCLPVRYHLSLAWESMSEEGFFSICQALQKHLGHFLILESFEAEKINNAQRLPVLISKATFEWLPLVTPRSR